MVLGKGYKVLRFVFAILLAILFAFPIYWMLVTALKTVDDLTSAIPSLVPSSFAWSNFLRLFEVAPMARYTSNTVIMTAANIFFGINFAIVTGYAFAKGNFRGRDKLFLIIIAALIVPEQVTFVPVYLMLSKIGWLDTFYALIVPHVVAAYSIFMMRQMFKSISNDIADAAKVDGANRFHLIYRIMTPMAKPMIITLVVLKFIHNWNSYFWPLVMTNSENMRVITVGLAILKIADNEAEVNYNTVMAGCLIAVVPIMILFIFVQKHIVASMAHSTFK